MTHRAKFLSGGTLLLSLALGAALAPTVTSQRQNPPLTAQVPKPSANAAPGVSFVDVTKTAGLGDFRFVSGTPAKDYLVEAPGAGCAFIDYDNDGWLDIYLVNGSTLDALRGKAKAARAALYHTTATARLPMSPIKRAWRMSDGGRECASGISTTTGGKTSMSPTSAKTGCIATTATGLSLTSRRRRE